MCKNKNDSVVEQRLIKSNKQMVEVRTKPICLPKMSFKLKSDPLSSKIEKAIVVGATSGIGRALSKVLDQNGYSVGIIGRRKSLLKTLSKELSNPSYMLEMDIADTRHVLEKLPEFFEMVGNVALIVISSGTGKPSEDLVWENEKAAIDVNVMGFSSVVNVAYHEFVKMGKGHIVGISSIAGIRGGKDSPAYYASKAFVSNYLQGIRCKIAKQKLPIAVTDVMPGFVDTDMAKGDGLFWVASTQKAVAQIMISIKKRKRHVYITKRWRIIAWLLKTVPEALYLKLG